MVLNFRGDELLIEAQSQNRQAQQVPITRQDLEAIFIYCLRYPAFFADARLHLNESFFYANERQHLLLFNALSRVFDRDRAFCFMTMESAFSEETRRPGQVTITESEADDMMQSGPNGLLWSAFDIPLADLPVAHGYDLLRRFLAERGVADAIRLVGQHGGAGSVNISGLLSQLHKRQQVIATIGMSGGAVIAPEFGGPVEPPPVFHPTGIEWMDAVLGGQREGDCNGLIGVTGGGKTTLAAQLCADSARVAFVEAYDAGETIPLCGFFTYEEAAATITPRIWSAAMSIKRSKLERMDWKAFTTQGNLDEYERRLYAVDAADMLGERERWQIGTKWVNEAMRIYDMSGMGDNPMTGSGYIEEVTNIMHREADQGRRWRMVVIDWAGLMCERHGERMGYSPDEVRFLLRMIGHRMQREIAAKFKCTVWLVHQLRGDVSNVSPTKLMHHSDAAESKQFAVHMSVCGCLGSTDRDSGCARINWSKVRYRPARETQPNTIRIDDTLARIQDVSKVYVADETSRRFILREMAEQIQGASAATQRSEHPGLHYGRRATALLDDGLM
jgi:hypothetical protein